MGQMILQVSEQELRLLINEEVTKIVENSTIKQDDTSKHDELINGDKALAIRLGCTVQTIHKLRHNGTLPHYRFGHRVYYKLLEVDDALRVSPRRFTKTKKG